MEELINSYMLNRGFEKKNSHWLLGGIKIRHRKIRLWLKQVSPENIERKLAGEIEHLIKTQELFL